MHQKLTKHGKFCKQNNQLPTKAHVVLQDNSIGRSKLNGNKFATGEMLRKPVEVVIEGADFKSLPNESCSESSPNTGRPHHACKFHK